MINKSHVKLQEKFESDQAKPVVSIVPTRFHSQSAKVYLDPGTKINRVPSLIGNNLHVKF